MTTNGNVRFSAEYAKINCFFSQETQLILAVLWQQFVGKKFCWVLLGFCAERAFCHSGIEVVPYKGFKCGVFPLSTITASFAEAEGCKPCWHSQRSYSASSILLSKLLSSETINHSRSTAIPTIILNRCSWPCYPNLQLNVVRSSVSGNIRVSGKESIRITSPAYQFAALKSEIIQ